MPGVGTAIGAAVGSGLSTGIKTGNPLAGLASAGGSYLGGQLLGGAVGPATSSIGGSIAGGAGSTALNAVSDGILGGTIGSTLGSSASNILPSFISNASLGGIAGSTLGSSLGESLFAGGPRSTNAGDNATAPFSAKQEDQLSLPGSLSGFEGLSPLQFGTNLATQGVYGGGNGPEESNYFANMVNRRLVDQSGNVDSDFSDIQPIEMSYLSQLGFGDQKTPKDLLEALSRRAA